MVVGAVVVVGAALVVVVVGMAISYLQKPDRIVATSVDYPWRRTRSH